MSPAYPQPRGGLSEHELEQVRLIVAQVLRTLTPKLGAETWRLGMEWYDSAHAWAQGRARQHGVPFDYVAGIVAALSPRIQWKVNLDDADDILENGDEATPAALGANVGKALWILDGTDPDSELGGRKVRSFWHNITSPTTSLDVTLDGWMAHAIGIPDRYLERRGVYDAISDAFREVAYDHAVLPMQLQAAIWIDARDGHE